MTAAILQLVLTAVVHVRRRLLYTGSSHKSDLWALHVIYQITLAVYRALRWSLGHSSEDARSRYIPDTKRQRPFPTSAVLQYADLVWLIG